MFLFRIYQCMFWPNFTENRRFYPKGEGFSRKTSASFRLLKIYKHVTPSQRDMSTQNAVSQ